VPGTPPTHLLDVQNGKNTDTGLYVITNFGHSTARVCVRDGVELLVTRFTGAAPLPLFIHLSSFDDKHAFRG
jgi:hypothetical protein